MIWAEQRKVDRVWDDLAILFTMGPGLVAEMKYSQSVAFIERSRAFATQLPCAISILCSDAHRAYLYGQSSVPPDGRP